MPEASRAETREIGLVSVSIDLGAGRRGVDMGPSALRIAGIRSEIEQIGHSVHEVGTITAGGFEVTESGAGALPFLNEIHDVTDVRGPPCGGAWIGAGCR